MIVLYLRITFLILLCIPVIYIGFILFGNLIDNIIHKDDHKANKHKPFNYKEDHVFQEYRQKKSGDFKVIR